MPCEELDIVWNNIKAEARALADCEPMLASFYHATLLKHENLGSALSYMLANKLASSIMPAIAIREVVEEAYAADPEMIASAACDIQAVRTRDPAVDKYSTPLLYLKGFHALQAYRIGHWLWKEGRRALAIFLQNRVSVTFRVDIHPAAKIGRGSCSTMPPGLLSVRRRSLKMTCRSCSRLPRAVPAKPAAIAIRKFVKG